MDAASAAAKWNNETGGNVCQEVATMPACHFDDSSREREEKKKKKHCRFFFLPALRMVCGSIKSSMEVIYSSFEWNVMTYD